MHMKITLSQSFIRLKKQGNLFVYACITTLMLLSFSAQAQNTASISGIVKSADGQPIEGATVSIAALKLNSITDYRGEFRFNRLAAGNYTLAVRFLSLQGQDQQATVAAGQNTRMGFVLTETLK